MPSNWTGGEQDIDVWSTEARTVQVSFDPSSPGAKSANLSIASDDGDEPTVNVALSGTGLGSDVVVWRVYLPLVLNSE